MKQIDNLPWVESPFFDELVEQDQTLSADMRSKVQFFSENGYLIVDLEIDKFDSMAEQIIQNLSAEQKSRGSRVQDAWRFIPQVKEIACQSSILQLLRTLYRREPIPFQTLNFKLGTQQATHSDLIHFNCFPKRYMAGVWAALEDVDENNGPLHYYPGSHKLPTYELQDLGLQGSSFKDRQSRYGAYEQFIQRLVEKLQLKKEIIRLKRGQALIWAANLLHGGEPIQDTARTRHSQVTHYYFENCRYYNPLYSDLYLEKVYWKELQNIRTGKKVPHVYSGTPVRLPFKQKIRYFIERSIQNHAWGREIHAKAKAFLTRS